MKQIKISLLAALVFVAASCSDFGDLNVDPNNTTSVAPASLLTNSLRSFASVLSQTSQIYYVQYMSQTQYTDATRYSGLNFDFNGWYTGPLADLNHIIDLNTDEATKADALQSGSNANQIAVARIMSAYFYQFMTDRWGPLPYSAALQGRDNLTPTYDSQEAIYNAVLSELKEAVAQMDGGAPVEGDFVMGGDMEKWAQFANTIRAIAAMRLSEVEPQLAATEFADAIADGIITEDVMYPYLAEALNQNPWFGRFLTRTDYAISSTLVDYMKPLNDPRLNAYADPAPNFGDVQGMPYGIINAGDIPNDDISFPGFPAVRGQDAPIAIVTMSQMLFAQAEAVERGWISGDAEQFYNDAIKASMEQWGVFDQAAYDAYIAQPGVAYDASNYMEVIHNQKWVAMYLQGQEAWSEWRRSGFPTLSPAPVPLSDLPEIPVRHGYPTSERDINSTNYDAAVGTLLGGEDWLHTPLWWDK
ncbi:MAG: SusD/RagB family nutrient-binding outer membrane lipoprotein [Bacteroidota bacterium]